MQKQRLIIALGVMLAAALPTWAYTVDGSLGDWGAIVADNNASMLTFGPLTGLLAYYSEDQDDLAGDSGNLGPNLGGQNYDAETLAAAHDGSTLFLAIVTGQRPDNGFERFAPGDLRIETSGGSYALEIGGGVGAAAGTAQLEGDAGSTYTLNGNGFTAGHAAAAAAQTVGSIWTDVTWLSDPINPPGPTQFEIAPGSTLVGQADYHYTRDASTTQHAIIELAFDALMFGGETIESVHWRPSCGNDELDLEVSFVPEPGSLALVAAGLITLVRRHA